MSELAGVKKEVHELRVSFDAHVDEKNKFQDESLEAIQSLRLSVEQILNKLDPKHDDYINKEIESRITTMESKLDQVWGLFQGLSFSGKAIKYTAGVVVAFAAIVTSLFALIRFVK